MNNLRTCLENTPPELASDIMERGHLPDRRRRTALGPGSAHFPADGMPVVLADNPMDCVAIGTGILSGDLERLKHITRVAEEA